MLVGCNGSSMFFSPSVCNNNPPPPPPSSSPSYCTYCKARHNECLPWNRFILSVHLQTVQRTCVLNAVLSSVVGDVAGACCGCGGFSTFTCIKTATVTSGQKTTLRLFAWVLLKSPRNPLETVGVVSFTDGLQTNVPAEQTALKQFIYPADGKSANSN